MNSMKYKGYTGVVELDEESAVLFGRVIGLRDVITFQGSSVTEVIRAFHDSVDDYLEFCASAVKVRRSPIPGSSSCASIPASTGRWPMRPRRRARA